MIEEDTDKKKKQIEKHRDVLEAVMTILEDIEKVEEIMIKYDKKNESIDEYRKYRKERILKVLELAKVIPEDYLQALRESCMKGIAVILQRDIDEIFINNYNPEWILAWDGNIDIQPCFDFFAVITYITEYYTKDDSGTMDLLLKALKETECESLKEKIITLMNTFICARQMGEAEAFYKIFPDFHLKDSNVVTVFVPVSRRENRSKFLLKVDESFNYNGQEKFEINGREGLYVEKYDIISKYERSKNKSGLSFSHFAKMFNPAWNKKEDNEENLDSEDEEGNQEFGIWDSKYDFVMKCFGEPHERCKKRNTKLPNYL